MGAKSNQDSRLAQSAVLRLDVVNPQRFSDLGKPLALFQREHDGYGVRARKRLVALSTAVAPSGKSSLFMGIG
jgi:hypothetical protein